MTTKRKKPKDKNVKVEIKTTPEIKVKINAGGEVIDATLAEVLLKMVSKLHFLEEKIQNSEVIYSIELKDK